MWQPIETCPEGEAVILYGKDDEGPLMQEGFYCAEWGAARHLLSVQSMPRQ